MYSKILAGTVVVLLMGLTLMGFTYNGGINQRGPLGIMGTLGTYVFPHAANRGLSIQDSSNNVGTSAAWYVTPAGAMTSGAITSTGSITGTSFLDSAGRSGNRITLDYDWTGDPGTSGDKIMAVQSGNTVAAATVVDTSLYRYAHVVSGTVRPVSLTCSNAESAGGGAGDQWANFRLRYHQEGETDVTSEIATGISTIDLTVSGDLDSGGTHTFTTTETSGFTGMQWVSVQATLTDADAGVTNTRGRCTLIIAADS